jgi:hypothetical protein
LILLVRGSLSIGPIGRIISDGSSGGAGGGNGTQHGGGGGASGGGRVVVLHTGSYSSSGTVQAAGGVTPAIGYGYQGGSGGNGAVTIDQIDP